MKWLAIVSLLALTLLAVWVGYEQWTLIASVDIPLWGWFFIVLGVGLSLAVGVGLMALMFYSSRQGYDDDVSKFDQDKRD